MPAERHPFHDPALPLATRVDDLLGRLTRAEKVSLLHQYQPAIPRLGVPAFRTGTEALHGVAWLGPATVFPQAVGLGATWDPGLVERVGAATGDEVRGYHHADPARCGLNVWAPVVNLLRDPRWGRNEEGYSEDPLLTGVMSSAYARGLRGDDPDRLRTAPVLKHFLAHNNEVDRVTTSSSVRERVLREYDLEAFRPAIAAGAACGIMPAYNLVNGRPNHCSPLIGEVVRAWTGEDLLVVSDAMAPSNIAGAQGYHPTHAAAHAAALRAGVDSFTDNGDDPAFTVAAIEEALDRGLLDEADVDRAVRHILAIRFRLGDLDPPGTGPWSHITADVIDSPAHRALAREAARAAIVLLRNEARDGRRVLPLRAEAVAAGGVAVVGPLADALHQDWYSGTMPYRVTPAAGIAERLGPGAAVTVREGVDRVALRVAATGALVTAPAGPDGGPLVAVPSGDRGGGVPDGAAFDLFDWGEGVVALRSAANGGHVAARAARDDGDEDGLLVNDQPGPNGWVVRETFALAWRDDGACALRNVASGRWVAVDGDGRLAAVAPGDGGAAALRLEVLVDGAEAAARAAAGAAAAIVVAGNHPMVNGRETEDRRELALPPAQRRLIRAVLRANPATVLALVSSYPEAIAPEDGHVGAILWSSHGGQELGRALADVIFGDHAPAGRLPQTWPRSVDDLPDILDYDLVASRRTYLWSRTEPLYPFGHGLTYTTFDYRDLRLLPETVGAAGRVAVRVDVANTGEVAADEVVQVYVRHQGSAAAQPVRRLLGFARRRVAPGETATVEVGFDARDLAFWDVGSGRWVVESGRYEVLVGASSGDIRGAAALTVEGETIPPRRLVGRETRAAAFDDCRGIRLVDEHTDRGDAVAAEGAGAWVAFHDADLGDGAGSLSVRACRAEPGEASIRLVLDDPVHGRVLGSAPVAGPAGRYGWATTAGPLRPATGVHDVYLVCTGTLRVAGFTLHPRA